ncbi:unnamed protein product, partial [Closterium sp. NIES-54]
MAPSPLAMGPRDLPPLTAAPVPWVRGWQEGVLPARVPYSRTCSSAPAPLPPLHGDGGERV